MLLIKKLLSLKKSLFIGLLSGSIGFFGASHALTVTSGCASASFCTLDELFQGGGIQVDGVSFGGFSTPDLGTFQTSSDVIVSGIGGSTNVGLEFRDFGTAWGPIKPNSSINRSFNYAISVSGSSQLVSSTLNMTNGNGGLFSTSNLNAGIDITSFLTPANTFTAVSNLAPLNSAAFSGTGFLNNFVDLSLFAGLNSSVDLDIFQQRFGLEEVSAVPVPAAIWLFGSALVFLSGFHSRKKNS